MYGLCPSRAFRCKTRILTEFDPFKSVQSCLPKDQATLWNQEFVQTEELFKQPSTVDNYWFCGVSNPHVKRTAGETHLGNGTHQVNTTGVSGLSNSYCGDSKVLPRPQQKEFQQSSPHAGVQQ